MAIKIGDLPTKNGGYFHSYVNVYQRVNSIFLWFYGFPIKTSIFLWFSYGFPIKTSIFLWFCNTFVPNTAVSEKHRASVSHAHVGCMA